MALLHSLRPSRSASLGICCLVTLLGVAAWLRLVGLTYDRPFDYHPDEWLIAKPAMHIAATGDVNPHTFLYPSLLTYAETGVVEVVHADTGAPLTVEPDANNGSLPAYAPSDVDPSQYPYVEWGRVLVVFLGVLAVLTVALAGLASDARSTAGRATAGASSGGASSESDSAATQRQAAAAIGADGGYAWLAGISGAAFMALAVLPVVHSRYLTTDVPSALFCGATMAVTLLAISRPPDRTSDRLLILAGLLVGLAASTKYNAAAVALVPAIGYLTRAGSIHALRGWLPGAIRQRTPYLVALAAIAGFTVATPAILFDTRAVLAGIHFQIAQYNVAGHVGAQGDSPRYYLNYLWTTGFGPVLSLLAIAGIGWACIRHRAADLMLVGFALVYFVLVSIPTVRFERNLLPLVPFVALMAGRFVADAAIAVRDRLACRPSWLAASCVAVLLISLLVQPSIAAVGNAQASERADTRTVALAWVNDHLPPGSAVVREAYTPQLSSSRYRPAYTGTLSGHTIDWYRAHGFRYAIASSDMYDRYLVLGGAQASFYESLFAQPTLYRLEPTPELGGPTIVIVDLSPGE